MRRVILLSRRVPIGMMISVRNDINKLLSIISNELLKVIMPEIRFSFILFLLASIACVGQMTNTMFVPAIDLIANDLHVNPGSVQSVMGVYLFAYGMSQFIYGPLSDWYGRRPVVLVGLAIFCCGSL